MLTNKKVARNKQGDLRNMKRHPRFLVVLLALAAVLAVSLFTAACGASSGDTAATAATTATTTTSATTATPDSAAPTSGTIVVKGLVGNPMTITVESLKAMNPVTITAEHPKLGKQEYTGVRFTDLLAALKVQSGATTVDLGCSDGFMAEVSLADLKASADAMIAIGDDGSLNAVMPGMGSKAWAKDIVSMEFK
jgi:hypothetical protein